MNIDELKWLNYHRIQTVFYCDKLSIFMILQPLWGLKLQENTIGFPVQKRSFEFRITLLDVVACTVSSRASRRAICLKWVLQTLNEALTKIWNFLLASTGHQGDIVGNTQGCPFLDKRKSLELPHKRERARAPNVDFRKISVRKTIWDVEFSEHFL